MIVLNNEHKATKFINIYKEQWWYWDEVLTLSDEVDQINIITGQFKLDTSRPGNCWTG